MRMSTKSRFAVDAVVDLALREAAGPVSLASIGARQRISLSYLEQMFSRLRRAGIVASTRGPGGGYTLGRPAEQVTVADIVVAVDESAAAPVDDEAAASPARVLWQRLDAAMLQHMAAVTLASVVAEAVACGARIEPRPPRGNLAQQPAAQPPRTAAPNSVFAFGRSFAG